MPPERITKGRELAFLPGFGEAAIMHWEQEGAILLSFRASFFSDNFIYECEFTSSLPHSSVSCVSPFSNSWLLNCFLFLLHTHTHRGRTYWVHLPLLIYVCFYSLPCAQGAHPWRKLVPCLSEVITACGSSARVGTWESPHICVGMWTDAVSVQALFRQSYRLQFMSVASLS